MNGYISTGLETALYIVGYLILAAGLWFSGLILGFGRRPKAIISAVSCIFLAGTLKAILGVSVESALGQLDPNIQLAIGITAIVLLCLPLFKFFYSMQPTGSFMLTLVTVGCMYGFQFVVPKVGEKILNKGQSYAQSATSTLSQKQKELASSAASQPIGQYGARIATGAASGAQSGPVNEAASLKKNFVRGLQVYAERKAYTDNMSDEERQAYQQNMSSFMTQEGIPASHPAIQALQNARPEDTQKLMSFFQENSGSHSGSLSSVLGNIGGNGTPYSEADHQAMNQVATLYETQGIDAAIAKTKADLGDHKVNPEWAGSFLAAMIQTKAKTRPKPSHDSLADEIAKTEQASPYEAPVSSPQPSESPADQEPAAPLEAASVVTAPAPYSNLVSVTTSFGRALLPNSTDKSEWRLVVNDMAVTGKVVSQTHPNRARVTFDNNATVRIGEVYTYAYHGKTYLFKLDSVNDGEVTISAMP